MTSVVHAAASIEPPGTHPEANFLGLTINTDTVLTTVIAAVIVIGLGLIVRRAATSGVPRGPQLFFETVFKWAQDQVRDNIGLEVAPYVVPLAFTEFVFILICNWISVLPVQVNGKDLAPPPTADTNLTYAMMIFVIVWVHVAGIRANGVGGYLVHIARGPGHARGFTLLLLGPINYIIEVVANPIALALRLFGNIFAGTIMVSVIGLLPAYVLWAPNFGWKLFDMAIGLIQAFVFALLTILYFGQAARPQSAAAGH
jgi:F-type H+-transporting ATPase subunit a